MKPVLFFLPGGRPIFAYGAMLGLGLLLAFLWTSRRGGREAGVGRDRAGNAALLAIAVGLLFARLFYVWLNPELVADAGSAWWDVQAGGLSGMGGAICGLASAGLYLKFVSAPLPTFADACAPALGVVQGFTALGAYLFGSDFGVKLADDAPAFLKTLGTFPRWEVGDMYGPPVLVFHVDRYYLPLDVAEALPVHPVQLYMVALGLVAVLLSLWLDRGERRPGAVFMPVAIFLLVGRFVLEYLRADPDRGVVFDFSLTQLLCLFGVPLLWIAWLQWRVDPPAQVSASQQE